MATHGFQIARSEGDRHVARTQIGVWVSYTLLENHFVRCIQERLDHHFRSPKKGPCHSEAWFWSESH